VPSQPALVIGRFEELVALAAERRDLVVKAALERDVRLVRCEDGRIEIALEPSAAKSLVGELARKLSQWTGRRWMVIVSAEPGTPTVKAQNDARQAELKERVRAHPLVQTVLARFPGAEIVGVSRAASGDVGDDVPPAAEADDGVPAPPIDVDDDI
jgi:DNA polymerase-3 subunit gamma/tau